MQRAVGVARVGVAMPSWRIHGLVPGLSLLLICVTITSVAMTNWVVPLIRVAGPGASPVTVFSPQPQLGSLSLSPNYLTWTATALCPAVPTNAASCVPGQLYLYDRHTRATSLAVSSAFGANGAIYNYHVSGTWLAYLDTGISGRPATLSWALVLHNIQTGKNYTVARSGPQDAEGVQPDLALYGHTLLWINYTKMADRSQTTSTVSLTDVVTHRTTTLAQVHSPFSFSHPALDGDHAVWQQASFTSSYPSSEIIGTALQHPHPFVLSGFQMASQPQLAGDIVAWKSGPDFAPGQIWLYRWSRQSAQRIKSPLATNAFSPVVGKAFVAWSVGSAAQVVVAHLQTDTPTTVQPVGTLHHDWIYGLPVAAGHSLAWGYTTDIPPRAKEPAPQGVVEIDDIS